MKEYEDNLESPQLEEQEERPGFGERLRDFGNKDIGFLSRSINGKLSWGLILLIAFAIYALVNCAIVINWIFNG